MALLILASLSTLFAADLAEYQRTEEWEAHLSRAGQLAGDNHIAEADALYRTLEDAAERFDFPLLLKAKCRNNHGALSHRNGRFAEAEAKYKEAARFWVASTGPQSDEHAATLANVGETYTRMGRYAEAESTFRSSLASRDAVIAKDQLRLASALNGLAAAIVQAGRSAGPRVAEAEASFQRALLIKREILGDRHPEVAAALTTSPRVVRIPETLPDRRSSTWRPPRSTRWSCRWITMRWRASRIISDDAPEDGSSIIG